MHKWRIFWGGTIGHFWLFWETKTPRYNNKLDFWQTKCCQCGEVCRKRKSEFIIVIPIFRMSEKLEYWISEYSDIPEIFRHSDISELRNSGISYYWNIRTFQYSDIPDFLNTRIFRCSEIPKSGISEYDLIGQSKYSDIPEFGTYFRIPEYRNIGFVDIPILQKSEYWNIRFRTPEYPNIPLFRNRNITSLGILAY